MSAEVLTRQRASALGRAPRPVVLADGSMVYLRPLPALALQDIMRDGAEHEAVLRSVGMALVEPDGTPWFQSPPTQAELSELQSWPVRLVVEIAAHVREEWDIDVEGARKNSAAAPGGSHSSP